MNYQVQYDNQDHDLITRLLKIRKVDENREKFLDSKINDYRLDPFLLNDMDKAVNRIILAIQKEQKIMVFGDYDVDGVTSSRLLYEFFRKFMNYNKVSITFPNRLLDWYGLKNNHIDEIKAKNVDLIITVDNWITSINEASYAREQWIDLIITDHHHELEQIPQAFAVVNPQISPLYPFKWIAGVGVAFKLIIAIATRLDFDIEKKSLVFNYFLPVVTIWTVADVAPLIDENRALVKKWLELMNSRSEHLPKSVLWFINFLNLKYDIDTFHIGFLIWPRINAAWRLDSPYKSLYTLMYEWEKQFKYLQDIDTINNERKLIQEEMFKFAEKNVNHEEYILIAESESFHEWVVGIVSGKITEKYNKPSVVFKIDRERELVVGSLRWPEYFNVIEMISEFGDLLERFGWHKQAGGVTVLLKNFDAFKLKIIEYCKKNIKESDLLKIVRIDTKIYHDERNVDTLSQISKLAPFGEWNKEPVFMIENIQIKKIEKMWNNWKSHLKIHGQVWDNNITSIFRGQWLTIGNSNDYLNKTINIVGRVKKDTFNGWFYLDGIEWN